MITGVGVDIVEIDRIEQAIKRRQKRFLKRIFTPAEEAYCLSKPRPVRHFAARFAAKEAVSKALGTGRTGLRWTDIEVCRHESGRPYIKLTGGGAARARENGIADVIVSLSFNRDNAVAAAVAVGARGF